MSWAEVRARRLERSFLIVRSEPGGLVEAVRSVGGIHAQVQGSAELQLAIRVEGIKQSDARDALWVRRSLVKAWTVRGTLHLHPADELALWHAARRAVAGTGTDELPEWRDPQGAVHQPLSGSDVRAVRQAVWEVLDGRCLLREEIAREVERRVPRAAVSRLRSGFGFFLGELCQGPPQGSKVTFARPDQWIEGWREVDGQDAVREVCRRYLWTFGPARPVDFREWFAARGLTPAAARALFESLGDELEEIDVDGHRAYVLAGDTAFSEPTRSVRLLPEYDVYVMGFREREQLVAESVRKQVAAHGRGRYEGPAGVRFLLVDGVAAGLWVRVKRGKRLELAVRPARKPTRPQRAELESEAQRLGAFLDREPVLTVS